jgi:hypothetical protein
MSLDRPTRIAEWFICSGSSSATLFAPEAVIPSAKGRPYGIDRDMRIITNRNICIVWLTKFDEHALHAPGQPFFAVSLSNANAIITLRSLYAYYAPRMTSSSLGALVREDVMTRAINVLGVISPRPTVVTTHGKVCTVSYFLCQSVIVFGSIPLKCSRPSEQNIMNSTIATLDKTIKGVASPKQTSELFGSSLVLLLHINFTFGNARFDSIKHRVHFLAIFSMQKTIFL